MTKSVGLLDRAAILGADDLPLEVVEVPEWGGSVKVIGLTGTQRDAFEASVVQRNGKNKTMNLRNVRARLVSMTVVDAENKRIFGPQDVDELGKKSAAALDRVFSKAQELSGISVDDVEELTENFDDGQSDDLSSA